MPERTILLVEDEPPVRDVLARQLRHDGYTVIEARNGAEAVAQLRSREADIALVIVDMRLPYMSGAELLAWLRQQRSSAKLICISGYDRNIPADADCAYLQKPFTREQLLTAVKKALGG